MLKKTDIPPLSKERRQYLKKQKQRKRHILYWQIGILVVFIAAWEIAARVGLIDSFILSQPTRILRTYFNMAQNDLLMHMGVTIYETLVGFLLGAALGTLLAIVLWWSAFVSKVSEPYLVVLNSLPKIALGPVIIILVGAGTKAIIFMALAISLIVTVLEMLLSLIHIFSAASFLWCPKATKRQPASLAAACRAPRRIRAHRLQGLASRRSSNTTSHSRVRRTI